MPDAPPDWMQRHSTMTAAWRRSRETLSAARGLLRDGAVDEGIATIAVAGSLGRLEQMPSSDLDLIVVTREPVSGDVIHHVWDALRPLKLRMPKSDGIYGRAVTIEQLVSRDSLGVIDESKSTFGQRMQLLIEARSVWNEVALAELQCRILKRFTDETAVAPADGWRPLLDDLLRYHRSLCVHYARVDRARSPGWRELVTKAGHSRLLGIAGLLFLVGESTRDNADPLSFVADRLSLAPLQRIAREGRGEGGTGNACDGDPRFNIIADCYERFLASLAQADSARPDLAENAATLKGELLRYILDRVDRGVWSRRFLEHVIL